MTGELLKRIILHPISVIGDDFSKVVLGTLSIVFSLSFVFLQPTTLQADTKEVPVGLITVPGGAKLLRAGTETPLDARSGDLLFADDGLRTGNAPAAFLFCPAKSAQTLGPAGEVHFESTQAKIKSGKITDQKPTSTCFLPSVVRVAVASQQHYGVSMTRGVTSDVAPVPRDKLTPQVLKELAPIEAAFAADPNDLPALVAEAAIFEKNNLPANALEVYSRLKSISPDAAWVKAKIFEVQQAAEDDAQKAGTVAPEAGQTYAILIGISKYKDPELELQFAAADAEIFDKLFQSPRGGGLPPQNILTLLNEKATTAAVRNGFQDFLKRRAGKNDTVIIMVAGHGSVETPGSKNAFILTYDADPQDLGSTALAMAELQSLFEEQLTKVRRVILLVDVCKAGTIGSIRNTSINGDVQKLGDAQGDLLGLMASRPRELSLEGPQFGGGHGAFSYFAAKGLAGAADLNKDGIVDVSELIEYVGQQVSAATGNKQHPREFGNYDNNQKLSDLSKPGIEITQAPMLYDSRSGEPLYLASASAQIPELTPQANRDVEDFSAGIRTGRLVPSQPRSAFELLQKLEKEISPEQYIERRNELQIALENGAQDVLLRYLQGDQIPLARQDFALAADYLKTALNLVPESVYLEARWNFFEGRSALFDKRFAESARLLEDSVRLDPNGAYAYNALGIAYLEQAQYDKAVPAFRDAVRRAQHWSYPLHNLALAYSELGNYTDAIRSYEQAMRLSPRFTYLPYNLGLIYQKIGRRKDAEASFQRALALSPESAMALNALGSAEASGGKSAEAEKYFRKALEKDPKLLTARQNLATLLASTPTRRPEALELWQGVLAESPDYIPARLGYAQALVDSGNRDAAVEQYSAVVRMKPDYPAARLALARLLRDVGKPADALDQLRLLQARQPENFAAYEMAGDIEMSEGNRQAANDAWQSALQKAPDNAARKVIRAKLSASKNTQR
jgi:tetratricopeptide (TPR) repeat protein